MLKIVCIPCYNGELRIGEVVKKSLRYVDQVVVCDDGSSDKTSVHAESAGAHVIKHEKNQGKGVAMKSLFDYAKKLDADIMVTIDGDGQFLPEEIPKLVKPIIENESDIVIGYRFDTNTEMPYYRKVGNKLLDKVSNIASEFPFEDTQSGFRAYSKKAIQTIKFSTEGFGVDSEILIDASKKGLKISEKKVTVLYDIEGETSTKNPVSHVGDVIYSLIELVAIRQPLRYLGIPGMILMIIGIIYSVVVIAIFNDTRYFSIPSTLLALGSVITGIMLLLMSAVLFSISRATRRQL